MKAAEGKQRIKEVLESVELTDTGEKMVATFSSGMRQRLLIARALHVLMIISLLMLVYQLQLGVLAVCGLAAVTALLVYEHGLVKPNDLSRVNAAFFTMNGWVSVLFFVFWAADIFLHPQHI